MMYKQIEQLYDSRMEVEEIDEGRAKKMNKAEQEQIIEEVVRRLKGDKTMIEKSVTTPRALIPTHMKWFRDENGNSYNSKMTQATGEPYYSWQIWELIRRATCVCCGVQYVRQLRNEEKANEVADKICQLIYDLAMENRDRDAKTEAEADALNVAEALRTRPRADVSAR